MREREEREREGRVREGERKGIFGERERGYLESEIERYF